MMIDKILASSFLDFTATYRLHLWNRKKTKRLCVPIMVKLSFSVQAQRTSSARRSKPTGLFPLLTSYHLLGSLTEETHCQH